MYMAIGLCLGVAFGTALDNLPLGIAIGVAVGAGRRRRNGIRRTGIRTARRGAGITGYAITVFA